eukprot:Colp12_sorted_trinity150504_noHs@21304
MLFSILMGLMLITGLIIAEILAPIDFRIETIVSLLLTHLVMLYSGWISKRHARLIFFNYAKFLRERNATVALQISRAGKQWSSRIAEYGSLLWKLERGAVLARQAAVKGRRLSIFDNGESPPTLNDMAGELPAQNNIQNNLQNEVIDEKKAQYIANGTPSPDEVSEEGFSDLGNLKANAASIQAIRASGNQFELTRGRLRVRSNQGQNVEVKTLRGTVMKLWRSFWNSYVHLSFEDRALECAYNDYLVSQSVDAFRILSISTICINTAFCINSSHSLPASVPELNTVQLPLVNALVIFCLGITWLPKLTARRLHTLMMFTQLSVVVINCCMARYSLTRLQECDPAVGVRCWNRDIVLSGFGANVVMIALNSGSALKIPVRLVWLFYLLFLAAFFGIGGNFAVFRLWSLSILLIAVTIAFAAALEQKVRLQFLLMTTGGDNAQADKTIAEEADPV